MTRLYDCFPFFNELDLLELRLSELYDVVDRFVMIEAGETFTGKKKPYNYEENAERFARFADKITYLKLESFPEGLDGWQRERLQRDKMMEGLADAAADDLVLLSDLDEIPDAAVLAGLVKNPPGKGEVYCLELRWFYYFMNLERRARWLRLGPRLIRRDQISTMQALRYVHGQTKGWFRDLMRAIKAARGMKRWVKRTTIANAGWHFTWLGGAKGVAAKAWSLTKHSSMPENLDTLPVAEQVIAKELAGIGTHCDIVDVDESFPKFVRENPAIFDKYLVGEADNAAV